MPYAFCEQIGKEIRDISDEIPFEIPDSWEWVRLGSICEIARGGSPRPIKQFLTDDPSWDLAERACLAPPFEVWSF